MIPMTLVGQRNMEEEAVEDAVKYVSQPRPLVCSCPQRHSSKTVPKTTSTAVWWIGCSTLETRRSHRYTGAEFTPDL